MVADHTCFNQRDDVVNPVRVKAAPGEEASRRGWQIDFSGAVWFDMETCTCTYFDKKSQELSSKAEVRPHPCHARCSAVIAP